MPDLLGPADAPNAVTTRPPDSRVFPATDTFFQDCTSPSAGDGTRLTADFFNGWLAQLRRAIVGMGVTIDNADDDMLLKAIQAMGALSVSVLSARAHMPIFPEVTAASGLLGVTGSTGEVVVTAGNTFLHRGVFLISTDDYSAGARTFATAANKTYHLRWLWNAGTPVFALKDLADTGYNPTAAAETSSLFDSTYDDMLVARIVTSGANAPTITMLVNKHVLFDVQTLSGTNTADQGQNGSTFSFAATLNWGRTPKVLNSITGRSWNDFAADPDMDRSTTPTISRYAVSWVVQDDLAITLSMHTLFKG